MTTDIQVADLIEKAADILEVNGWLRGALGLEDLVEGGWSYCSFGALNMADHNSYDYSYNGGELVRYAGQVIQEHLPAHLYPYGSPELVHWNNHVAKDKYEVIDLFRHTAKELRNEANTASTREGSSTR